MKMARNFSLIAGCLSAFSIFAIPAWPQTVDCKQHHREFYATMQTITDRLKSPGNNFCEILASAYDEVQKADDLFEKLPCPETMRQDIGKFALDMIEDIYRQEHQRCGAR
jgi:hypothetical protein